MSHNFNPRIFEVTVEEGVKPEECGWWFAYNTLDGERTEDGPFKTYSEASDALMGELEEQLTEAEFDA